MTIDNPADQDAPPSPIPLPPEFPISWERPEQEQMFWTNDRMHFPEPVTPMMAAFAKGFNEGFNRAAKASEVPMGMEHTRINSYFYTSQVPRVPPEEMEAQGEKAAQTVGANIARLREWWDGELLPEVKSHLAYWEGFDLQGASMDALLRHFEDTLERLTRLWDIHFLIAFPFIIAPSMFDDLYQDLFGKEDAFDAYRLTQGFGNRTVDSGHALWALSRKAMGSEVVRKVLEEIDSGDVPAALEGSDEGKTFLVELQEYLEEYGQRSDVFAELGNPHWIENPSAPINNLKDYITQPDRDLGAELAALAAERERLIGESRERLKGYPQSVRDQFEFLLKAAQTSTMIQEDHNYWIDQRGTYKVRQVILEFGRRFAESGLIEQANDVFYMTPEEVRETASAEGDRRGLVAERKAEMERFGAMEPPAAIGTPPTGPPPPDNPMLRAFGKFFGEPPKPSDDPGVINGNPGSPGKVTGIARVVPTLSEAGRVAPGEILVAPATMPAWTPLFASIAAVVTDAGGVLSHAAIVAREYNIPAVLGTGNATSVIKDGQTIEVDGNEGVVRILS